VQSAQFVIKKMPKNCLFLSISKIYDIASSSDVFGFDVVNV
jgi:hypothetical protein